MADFTGKIGTRRVHVTAAMSALPTTAKDVRSCLLRYLCSADGVELKNEKVVWLFSQITIYSNNSFYFLCYKTK